MLKADKNQKQRIAILVEGDTELKARLVQEATGDTLKTSTNDLSFNQANAILVKFKQKPFVYQNWAFFDKNNRSHKYILSLAIQYGWCKNDNKWGEVADLSALDKWLRGIHKSGQSPVLKPLKDMNTLETSKVISALERMVSKKH